MKTQILPPPNVQSEIFYLWKRYKVPIDREDIKTMGELIRECQTEIRKKAHNYISLKKRLLVVTEWFYKQETLSSSQRITNLLDPDAVERHIKKQQISINDRCHRCKGEGFIINSFGYSECSQCEGSGYK